MAYKDLWQVERTFRDLKSDLDLRPIHHWTTRRIHRHVMVCFLAFVLKKTPARHLKRNKPDLEYGKARTDLDDLKILKLTIKGRDYLVRTELRGETYELFRAVGSCPPQRVAELNRTATTQV